MIDNIAYEGVDIRKRVSSNRDLPRLMVRDPHPNCYRVVDASQVAEELSSKYHKQKAKVLDLCCGVGFSTRALVQAFPDAEKIVGVDTSPQMLAMARFISAHVSHLRPWWNLGQKQLSQSFDQAMWKGQMMQTLCGTSFKKGNAESTPFKDGSFDVVTIM